MIESQKKGISMTYNQAKTFSGFSSETVEFLRTVRQKNSKPWFERNRGEYQEFLLEPLRKLVMELSGTMLAIDSAIDVQPLIGKTISRIFRDTRFSKDKSLFKNRMWITFKRLSPDWKDAPAFYFEITPEFYRYGMGFYQASRKSMDQFRQSIDQKPDKFLKIISDLTETEVFELGGEKYVRPLSNEHPEKIQDWYQRKSFYLMRKNPINQILFSAQLVSVLISDYELLKPLYHYILRALGK